MACKSIRYCSVTCQRSHRKHHKTECKQKERELMEAAAKKADEELFAQTPPRDVCPICCLRLPSRPDESTYHTCCGKMVCNGCDFESTRMIIKTNMERKITNLSRTDCPLPMLPECCAFCRAPDADAVDGDTNGEILNRLRKRMEMNDAEAFYNMAGNYRNGINGLPQDNGKAFELMTRAAELGKPTACQNLGCYYQNGIGVERDKAKELYFF